MANILLSLLILLCFASSGYWLYVILGNPSNNALTKFLISAWAGLLVILLSLTNLYSLSQQLPAHSFALPLFVSLSLLSFLAVIFYGNPFKKEKIRRSSLAIILISLIATLSITTPLTTKKDLTFYYVNNAEYFTYAFIADVVQFNSYNTGVFQAETVDNHNPTTGAYQPERYTTQAREAVIGLLCSFISTLTGKSTLFVIEPLSNAFALLAFLTLGTILIQLDFRRKNYWYLSVIFIAYFCALFSSANIQFWTLSFMSQYLNQVIVIGLVLFLQASSSKNDLKKIIALGITIAGTSLAYPEALGSSCLIIGFIYLFMSSELTFKNIMYRLAALTAATFTALAIGNLFLFTILTQSLIFYKTTALSLPSSQGADIYGSTHNLAWLVGDLFGLNNIFWTHAIPCPSYLSQNTPCIKLWRNASPSPVPFYCFIALLLIGFIKASQMLIMNQWHKLKILPLLLIVYLLTSGCGLWWLSYRHFSTNYIAVKFIISLIWVSYIALAYLFATIKSFLPRCVVAALGLIFFIAVLEQGFTYSHKLRTDKQYAYYSETDALIIRNLLQAQEPLLIAAPVHCLVSNMIANFLVLDKNLWESIDLLHKNAITDLGTKEIQRNTYLSYNFILVLGIEHAQWLEGNKMSHVFSPIYQSSYLTLLHKKI